MMNKDCFICNINQMNKICSFLNLDQDIQTKLIKITDEYQKNCDMSKTNPEIMGDIWKKIAPIIGTDNPYKDIKSYYNKLLLSMESEINERIVNSNDKLNYALKVSIAGNLIDFAAKHTFNENTLLEMLNNISNIKLSIDDSKEMCDILSHSNRLLYLGDNCGEIVLDKCFIKVIKQFNPQLELYYGVRGKPIVNDVTIDDAIEVNMDSVATIISNDDGSLGTVLSKTSNEFQDIFNSADIVICKGQGNYEGLLGTDKENIFFLFMAKCDLVAKPINVKRMSIVCLKNKQF